ncbi:MAG: sigma 54-interacting transcriptional regulator [Halieaceae bacterium]
MTDSPPQRQPGILIIEDEALVARDIQSRLQQLGHRVVGLAHNPHQAIAKAEEVQPDLLLCDIHLKDEIDGIDVARAITEKLDIPVIFLTAYSDRETVARAKSIAPYGYVLKPIETPDLQIAIEMALHKFSIEQELRQTKQLLATALQCIGDSLVFVDVSGQISALNEDAQLLFGISTEEAVGRNCLQLLQDQAGVGKSAANIPWEQLLQVTAVTRLPPFQIVRGDGSQFLLDGVVGPTRERDENSGVVLILRQLAEFSDSQEGLPVPSELPDGFDNLYDYPLDHERAFVLLLISPDDQDELLRNLPEHTRELLIREIGEQLNLAMRSTDLASYYGGAVFSASLPYTTLEEANSISGAILQRLSEHWFLQETLTLSVSIGISHHRPGAGGSDNESPLELFRRANRALTLAQQSGGNRAAIWRPSTDIGLIGNLDGQSGLLTEDAGQDYRNMALLWNTMSTAADNQDSESLAARLVGRIRRSFNLEQAAFYRREADELTLLAEDSSGAKLPALSESQQQLIHSAAESGAPLRADSDYCIPVALGGGLQGALYLSSSNLQGELRQQDLLLIQSLLGYIANPGDRSPATTPAVSTLPAQESELLFQSNTMAEVMQLIQLVAPTDETVLITGESGTGKEVIAREIHRLSNRSEAPFVIVDCGAVVSSLIERELFGHVKGAFTGAVSDSPGKLKEADGGTLLLDEIGELPMDVQVKLLRVVQEKQFTAVGSTQLVSTNTRIIAATNVDLEKQIKQGKFREDLFYRLNVFNVHSPPLRSRDGDIIHLARHFLHSCSAQYGRDIVGFTAAAEELMQHYPWPGNIRELRNRLIRAVILCQGDRVDVTELDLRRESDGSSVNKAAPTTSTRSTQAETESLAEIEGALRNALAEQVSYCLENSRLLPLGLWLEQDLIYAALEQHGQVNLQAADALGLPESTLRRKLSRYQSEQQNRPAEFQVNWQAVAVLLPRWIRIAQRERFDPMRHLHNLLLSQISELARTQTEAATMVGVSPPTYRRQLSQLADW